MRHFAFTIENIDSTSSKDRLSELGFDLQIWRPSLKKLIPDYFPIKYIVYSLAHYAGIFPNRDYSAVIITKGNELVLKMLIVPRYFKWPFMGPNDLQFVYGTTNPDYRRLGVAKIAMDIAISQLATKGRKFWGIIREDNTPSIKWVEKVGFRYAGKIESHNVRGISFFRRLYLSE